MEFARDQVNQKLFSINRICQLCGISKNTFKNHKHPNERFLNKYSHIKKSVEKVIKDNSSYGVKRIKAALKEDYSIQIGRDALGRLLKLWSLNIRRKVKKPKIGLIKKILIFLADRTNLLIRTEIIRPLQAITSDISEIDYNSGKSKAYLCVHKDVFGQMVYGYEINQTKESQLVLNSFNKAIKSIKNLTKKKLPKNLICHQDQGSQYTSYEYVDLVLKNKIILSYSTPGTPTENPGQESFFGRFKEDYRDELNEIRDSKQLTRFIKRKIRYYNQKRLHTSLNNQNPLKFTKNYLKNISLSED